MLKSQVVIATIIRHDRQMKRSRKMSGSTEENWSRVQKMLMQTCSFAAFYLPVIVCICFMLINARQFTSDYALVSHIKQPSDLCFGLL